MILLLFWHLVFSQMHWFMRFCVFDSQAAWTTGGHIITAGFDCGILFHAVSNINPQAEGHGGQYKWGAVVCDMAEETDRSTGNFSGHTISFLLEEGTYQTD